MGIFVELVNYDRHIASTINPIVVNDLSTVTTRDRQVLDSLTTSLYSNTDVFSNEPSCACGQSRAGYLKGTTCPNCLTQVREPFDHELKPNVWMRAPNGVADLMNPMVRLMLSHKLNVGNFSVLDWLTNTDYQPAVARPAVIEELQELNVQRGYNNFVNNFDAYMAILFSLREFKPSKKKKKGAPKDAFQAMGVQEEELLTLLREQRDCVFSRHLPFPNKSLMIVESTQVGTFVDPIIIGIKDAICTMVSIDTPLASYTLRQRENRTAKAIALNAAYHYDVIKEILASKNGLYRKHVFGSRQHFSGRAVISSNTKAHQYDSLSIPWGLAVTLLKVHLTNKLDRMGYTPNQIAQFLQEYTAKTHPLLERLFDELIAESPNGRGIACTFGRNPSLTRSSLQRFFIDCIKRDVEDNTISLPILNVVGFNADFDGDEMNLVLALDNDTAVQLENLAPHKNVMSINKYRALSSVSRFPKPVASTFANWLHSPRTLSGDANKAAFLQSLTA